MSEGPEVLVSVVSGPSSASTSGQDGSGRILVSAETLRTRKLYAGQPILLRSTGLEGSQPLLAGLAWPSFTLSANAVQVTQEPDLPSTLKTGDSVLLHPVAASKAALSVKVKFDLLTAEDVLQGETDLLLALAKEKLINASYVLVGHHFSLRLQGTSFAVLIEAAQVDAQAVNDVGATIHVGRATVIMASENGASPAGTAKAADSTELQDADRAYRDVGGLDKQVQQIRELVELPLRRPELFAQFGLRPPKGVLLFGPPGTGKTTLARVAAASVQAHVLVINGPELSSSFHGETEQRLRAVFAEAKRRSPCVVVIDEIDALAPRRDEGTGEGGAAQSGAGEVERRTVATLLTLLDGVEQPEPGSKGKEARDGADAPRVVVIAATNRPNAIDPALRRPGRLDREIEIGIPNADARIEILKVMLRKVPHSLSVNQIEEMGNQTHGFVGADLSSLIREAGMTVIRRLSKSPDSDTDGSKALERLSLNENLASQASLLSFTDLQAAKALVRPSAMREVTLDPPKVYWHDIISTGDTQLRVREAVEWPLKHASAFRRLGIRPPRGVLLYGPPGCSKTMIAQALATESGLNFLSTKGPELYSKYVGESERAVRELFRKARAAAPSVVFLDEIDALTTTRGDESGAVGDRVIASLLTELDGVESVADVIVVAATNRPQVIDPALLRPGRLDRLLYVGPPDTAARLKIFQQQTAKMAVQEPGVDVEKLAGMTSNRSGAEIVSICQEAGMTALAEDINATEIKQEHFDQAVRSVRKRITPEMLAEYEAWSSRQDF